MLSAPNSYLNWRLQVSHHCNGFSTTLKPAALSQKDLGHKANRMVGSNKTFPSSPVGSAHQTAAASPVDTLAAERPAEPWQAGTAPSLGPAC